MTTILNIIVLNLCISDKVSDKLTPYRAAELSRKCTPYKIAYICCFFHTKQESEAYGSASEQGLNKISPVI